MPRWSLVVLGLGTLLLVLMAFGVVPSSLGRMALWASAGAAGVGAVVAGQRNLAIWCGLLVAICVLLQPVFPVDLGRFLPYVRVAGAIVLGACVIRHW